MIKTILRTDFQKVKRKGVWFFTLLGPFGVIALQIVNYGVRKDYLLEQSDDHWGYYLGNVSVFIPLAIVLGIAILTSLIASIENETSAWKQLLALPVSKFSVYLSKFTMIVLLLGISSCLLAMFILGFGIFLDLNGPIPYLDIVTHSFYPLLGSLPILALQLWLALVCENQGIPITIGIVGTLMSYIAYELPDWLIWKWPSMYNDWNEPIYNVYLGLSVGCILYVAGMFDFVRKDVK